MLQQNPNNTHISALMFDVPFNTLWERLSNPLNFPELYPSWTIRVERKNDREFNGIAPEGDSFTITPYVNREQGVIDFKIVDRAGHEEWSRSRIFPLQLCSCMYVHLAVRWKGIDDEFWEVFKQGTDRDIENAKAVLERQYRAVS
jgi:hypothetical protein